MSTRTVREWTPEVTEALQDCFESTDWDMFCEAYGDNCSELTECITDYIHFSVNNTVPTKTIRCFPNNKPWVTKELKVLLNEKKRVFREGDKSELKRLQKEMKEKICLCKEE